MDAVLGEVRIDKILVEFDRLVGLADIHPSTEPRFSRSALGFEIRFRVRLLPAVEPGSNSRYNRRECLGT